MSRETYNCYGEYNVKIVEYKQILQEIQEKTKMLNFQVEIPSQKDYNGKSLRKEDSR